MEEAILAASAGRERPMGADGTWRLAAAVPAAQLATAGAYREFLRLAPDWGAHAEITVRVGSAAAASSRRFVLAAGYPMPPPAAAPGAYSQTLPAGQWLSLTPIAASADAAGAFAYAVQVLADDAGAATLRVARTGGAALAGGDELYAWTTVYAAQSDVVPAPLSGSGVDVAANTSAAPALAHVAGTGGVLSLNCDVPVAGNLVVLGAFSAVGTVVNGNVPASNVFGVLTNATLPAPQLTGTVAQANLPGTIAADLTGNVTATGTVAANAVACNALVVDGGNVVANNLAIGNLVTIAGNATMTSGVLSFNSRLENNLLSLYGGSDPTSTNVYGLGVNPFTLRYNSSFDHQWWSSPAGTATPLAILDRNGNFTAYTGSVTAGNAVAANAVACNVAYLSNVTANPASGRPFVYLEGNVATNLGFGNYIYTNAPYDYNHGIGQRSDLGFGLGGAGPVIFGDSGGSLGLGPSAAYVPTARWTSNAFLVAGAVVANNLTLGNTINNAYVSNSYQAYDNAQYLTTTVPTSQLANVGDFREFLWFNYNNDQNAYVEITCEINASSMAATRKYMVATVTNQTNDVWYTLTPLATDNGSNGGLVFGVQVLASGGRNFLTFRIVRFGGTAQTLTDLVYVSCTVYNSQAQYTPQIIPFTGNDVANVTGAPYLPHYMGGGGVVDLSGNLVVSGAVTTGALACTGTLTVSADLSAAGNVSVPNGVLNFGNRTQNNIVCLLGGTTDPTSTYFYGFGVQPGVLRYSSQPGGGHQWWSGTTEVAMLDSTGQFTVNYVLTTLVTATTVSATTVLATSMSASANVAANNFAAGNAVTAGSLAATGMVGHSYASDAAAAAGGVAVGGLYSNAGVVQVRLA